MKSCATTSRRLPLNAGSLAKKMPGRTLTVQVRKSSDATGRPAASRGLTAYEAAYLELTLRRGLSLATLDDALIAAMSKAGVPAASPGS